MRNGNSEPVKVPHKTTPTSEIDDGRGYQQPVRAVHVAERGPDGDAQESDAPEDGAQRQARQNLPPHHPPPVLQRPLLQGPARE